MLVERRPGLSRRRLRVEPRYQADLARTPEDSPDSSRELRCCGLSADALLPQSALYRDVPRENERLNADEAIHAFPRLVVLGCPGSGKTTLMQYTTAFLYWRE